MFQAAKTLLKAAIGQCYETRTRNVPGRRFPSRPPTSNAPRPALASVLSRFHLRRLGEIGMYFVLFMVKSIPFVAAPSVT